MNTVDTLKGILTVLEPMLGQLRFRTERLTEAALGGFMLATDVADYLVEKKMPFRQAHSVVGAVVQWCVAEGKETPPVDASGMAAVFPSVRGRPATAPQPGGRGRAASVLWRNGAKKR